MEAQNLDLEYPRNTNDLIKLKSLDPSFVKYFNFNILKRKKEIQKFKI